MGVLLTLALVTGCGGGTDQGSAPSLSVSDPDGLQAAVASFDLSVGSDRRFLVGLFAADRQVVAHGEVELAFRFLGGRDEAGSAQPQPGPRARARFLALPGTEQPEPLPAAPTLVSGAGVRGVYAATVDLDRAGFWEVDVAATVDGQESTATTAFEVLADSQISQPGEPAPASENHTVDSPPEVPRAAIDSRFAVGGVVEPTLHRTTVAGALAAGRPVVVVISTPVYCRSQFCGPVTELVEDLAAQYGDRAEFVHLEVWRDFEAQEVNAAAAEWILADGAPGNEPWVFLVGADGVIDARYDNVVDEADLRARLDALPPG